MLAFVRVHARISLRALHISQQHTTYYYTVRRAGNFNHSASPVLQICLCTYATVCIRTCIYRYVVPAIRTGGVCLIKLRCKLRW